MTQVNYLSFLEQEVVAETNRAQTNPNAYAVKLENLGHTIGKQQKYYELSATDKLLTGRSRDCQIVLEDYPMVSRHHAEIRPKFRRCIMEE